MTDEVPRDPWGNPDPKAAPAPRPASGPAAPPSGPPGPPPPGAAGAGLAPPGAVPPMGWGSPAPPVLIQIRRDRQALVALVLGLVSLLCCQGIVGVVLGGTALTLGIVSRRRIDAADGALEGRGTATAGIVLGALGLVVGVATFYYFTFVNPDVLSDLLSDLTTTTTVAR